jgi:AraC-like DNA-binding protein
VGSAGESDETQRVGGVAAVPALLRQFGVETATVLNRAGLRRDALDHPENHISYAAMCRVLREATLATRTPHFGLLAGRAWRLVDMGLPGELALNSPTVGIALRNLCRFQKMNTRDAVTFVIERDGIVDFGYAPFSGELIGIDQVYDSTLATGLNYLRELCGDGFVAKDVFLARSRPDDVEPYRRLFHAPVHFDADCTAIRFSAEWMQRPVYNADPVRFHDLYRKAALANPENFIDDVYRALRVLLVEGMSSGDDVARQLGLQRRTLNRRLHLENTTFQDMLDEVRFAVACQLLGYTDVNMDNVAASLGYNNVSSFQRRFRHWTSTTPGDWRREFQPHHA